MNLQKQEEQKFRDPKDDYFTFLHALKAQTAIFAVNVATPLVVRALVGVSKGYLAENTGSQVKDELSLNIKLWSYPFYAAKYMSYLSVAYCGLDLLYRHVRIIYDFASSDDHTFKRSDDVRSVMYDLATKGYHGAIFSALGVGVTLCGGSYGFSRILLFDANDMTPRFADPLRFQVILENDESAEALELFFSYIKGQVFILAKKYIANEVFFHTINLLTDEKQFTTINVPPESDQVIRFMGHEEENPNHLIFDRVYNPGHEL